MPRGCHIVWLESTTGASFQPSVVAQSDQNRTRSLHRSPYVETERRRSTQDNLRLLARPVQRRNRTGHVRRTASRKACCDHVSDGARS